MHDVTNAFPPPSQEAVVDFCTKVAVGVNALLLQQCMTRHVTMVQCCDGQLNLRQGSGVPQGGVVSAGVFNPIYWLALSEFEASLLAEETMLTTYSPIDGSLVSVAMTSFVDDMASRRADRK
eukprot:3596491-Alexandrium_andersonii.AAC.1